MKAGEWTLRSRRVVTPSGTRAADVVIRGETIFDLLPYDGPEADGVILDAGNLAVLPGLVALHREGPGVLDGRWFEAATRDCGLGGVTTLIDLPPILDPEPAEVSASTRRMAAAEGKIRVDCGLVVPLGRGRIDRIDSWIEAGFFGVEVSLGDGPGGPPSTEADLRAAMPILAELGRPLFVDSGRSGRPAGGPDQFGSSLPEREFAAIRLLIRLCRETRCGVHLIQPSASEALPMIAEARAEGLPFTVETCPSHLGPALVGVATGPSGPPFAPSGGDLDARERLWGGLESGLVDAIGPDLPRSTADSSGFAAIDATSTLRLALPAVWLEARRRGFTLDHLARWLATRPAKGLGLAARKGSIVPGLDADFAVFDPDAPTPAGQVEATILRGTMIFQGGQFFDHPRGSVVLRLEETQPIPGTSN